MIQSSGKTFLEHNKTDVYGIDKYSYTPIDDVFEGMKFVITNRASILYRIFEHHKYVSIIVTMGVYFISYNGVYVADINNRELTLYPGIFINRNKQVFKIYNKLLTSLVDENTILKFIGKKWVVCRKEKKDD